MGPTQILVWLQSLIREIDIYGATCLLWDPLVVLFSFLLFIFPLLLPRPSIAPVLCWLSTLACPGPQWQVSDGALIMVASHVIQYSY